MQGTKKSEAITSPCYPGVGVAVRFLVVFVKQGGGGGKTNCDDGIIHSPVKSSQATVKVT